MSSQKLDPPLGVEVQPRTVSFPVRAPLYGTYASLIPIDISHADSLFEHLGGPSNAHLWTYMPIEPILTLEDFKNQVREWGASKDPQFYAILDGTPTDLAAEAVGIMSYLNIEPSHRRIEIGWIMLSEVLKRTKKATEVFYLSMKFAFENSGYDRVEWKANAFNAASLAAATRLGFVYEGTFRKHIIVKGRRRDTAWFSVTDDEWHVVKAGFNAWLDWSNFDENGKQKRALKEFREA